MSIFHILSILIIVYGAIDYKRAFLLFMIFALFLNQMINVINIPGVPLLTMKSFMSLCFTGLYFVRRRNEAEKRTFPLKKTYTATIISYTISLVLGVVAFNVGYSGIAKILLEQFFIIWLLWLNLNTLSDLKFLGIGYLIVFTIAAIYGIIENRLQINPLTIYEMQFAGDNEDKIIDFTYDTEYGRGYRIKSIFYHAIGASFNFAIYVMFCIYFMFKWNKYIKILTVMSLVLIGIAIIYTNSRTPFAFLLISLIPFFYGKKNLRYALGGVLVLLIIMPFMNKDSNFYKIILSLFDQKTSENLGGSSVVGREDQFSATLSIMMESPIWGIGPKATTILEGHKDFDRLLGFESIWIWTALERGFIGMGTLAYYFWVLVKISKKNAKMVFLVFAYIFTISATSMPGSYDEMLFVILFSKIKKIA